MRRVVLWASWRLLGWGVAGIAFPALLEWLASSAVLWWRLAQSARRRSRRPSSRRRSRSLGAAHEAWIKAGMLGKIEHCRAQNRRCIRVNGNAGPFGEQSDYRVIQGY